MGISAEGSILDLALEHDLVRKSGSFFSYGELRLGQGRINTKAFLAENTEIRDEIESKVLEVLGLRDQPASDESTGTTNSTGAGDAGEAGSAGEVALAQEPEREAA